MDSKFNWRDALEQLFSATLNQEPLEAAAKLMVSVSANDRSYHDECVFLFTKAKELASNHDETILSFINQSGYKLSNFDDALELIADFEKVYLQTYNEAMT